MRIHLLGLAHTETTREYLPCAYTQKVLKLARMLTAAGLEVIHYGGEVAEVPCEHVPVVTRAVQRECYGEYDWHREFFKHNPTDLAYSTFNANAIREINARKSPDDVLLISFGNYQRVIADAVQVHRTVEMGVGYEGVFARFRVFESYAWMHHVYGLLGQKDGVWYDDVISNFFDLVDFEFAPRSKGDYNAFLGRLIPRKGLQVAIDTCRVLGARLIVAGQGSLTEFNTDGVNVEHIGIVDRAGRNQLLGGAIATFLPTCYLEPFGGAAVESMLCGTPAITSDWGAFPETVSQGLSGFRCRTLNEFVQAAKAAGSLDREKVRQWAERYSTTAVTPLYVRYLERLSDLDGKGWYEIH